MPRAVRSTFADKGTIAHWLAEALSEQKVATDHALKKNMKPVLRTGFEEIILGRCSLIETVFDEFKESLPD